MAGDATLKDAIIRQLIIAIDRLDPSAELAAVIGSYGDTISDETVLECLKRYNKGQLIMTTLMGRPDNT